MKVKSLVLAIFSVGAFAITSWAQPYKTALGVRLGYPNQVNFSLKHNMGPHWALEFNVGAGYRSAGADFGIMYHFDIKKVPGMRWYLGGAVDAGTYYRRYDHPVHGYAEHGGFYTGTSIYGGLEYTFPDIPLNLAFDAGPRVQFIPWDHYPEYVRVGITARYTIK